MIMGGIITFILFTAFMAALSRYAAFREEEKENGKEDERRR